MKKILIGVAGVAILALLLAYAVFSLSHAHPQVTAGAVTSPPTNLDYVQISQAIGWLTSGLATPINETIVRQTLTAATGTPCAILNPFSATSSVPYVAFNVTTATGTAATLNFATSSTAFATTSIFANFSIAASQQQTVVYTGTSTGIGPVVAPGGYLVVGAVGAPAGFTYGGSCSAKFISVN